MATTNRYREGLAQRLGIIPPALLEYIKGHRIIWLHAVSVGEVLAASRLLTELEAALGDDYRIVISTTTRTGQHLARERFGSKRVFYMPLDFAFATRRYLRALNPAALILTESELWPRLLHECSTRNIPVAVINARMSDRSFTRAQKFRALWSHMARRVTLFLAQSEQDAQRLTTLGAPNVLTTGNLKYDIRAPRKSHAAQLIKDVANGRPIVVAGSTVDGTSDDEEGSMTTAWGGYTRNEHNAVLVLAPRHPERFEQVWKEDATEFPSLKVSDLLIDKETAPFGGFSTTPPSKADVILLDTIGDLAAVYGIADIAFVGGSLVPRGGHNPLEPAQFGIPVIMGPSYENFRDVVTKMRDADAIRIVNDGIELEAAFKDLLTNPIAASALGERGRQVYLSQQGATARTIEALTSLITSHLPLVTREEGAQR